MKLNAWMIKNDKKQAELAKVIGRNKSRASRICNGARPNDEEMSLIVDWTLGEVVPNDFYDIEFPEQSVSGEHGLPNNELTDIAALNG